MMNETDYTPDYWDGTRALHEGRPADAVVAFRRVPESAACWTMAQGNVGLALVTMGCSEQAEVQLRHTLVEIARRGCLFPPARIQFARNLGDAVCQQGRWVEALREFDAACELANQLANGHPDQIAKFEFEKAYSLNSYGAAFLHLWDFRKAVAVLDEARDILRRHPRDDRTGQAEALTNLATALDAMGNTTRARFALEEAIEIVQETGDHDQLFRILVAANRLGLDLYPADRILELVEAGAAAALESGRPGIAYLRFAQGASIAVRQSGGVEPGLRMVQKGRAIEGLIDPTDPSVPKLRLFEAMLLRRAEKKAAQYTQVLLEGANHWYRRIAVPLIPADFRTRTSDLHMHVRLLAGCLLEADRTDESLVSFEAGRALGYAVEVDPTFFSRMVQRNPFAVDGNQVDVSLLRNAQQRIGSDTVAVVLAVIPPQLVAFVIDHDRVRTVGVRLTDLNHFDSEIRTLPHRLAQGVGVRALHGALHVLGRGIAQEVGSRNVTSFIPYDSLHLVPWRALLRECGLPWHQLAFPVGFNFLLRRGAALDRGSVEPSVITLGHGTAGDIDLRVEARQFADTFGDRGKMLTGSTAEQVRESLQTNSVVLLSCHGKVVMQGQVAELVLELSDGPAQAETIFPERIHSPLVILSACDSGVYTMAWGDYPLGAGPALLRRGAGAVIGARFPVRARFAATFFSAFARVLAEGIGVESAFVRTLEEVGGTNTDLWRDLACLELLRAV